MCDDVKGVGLDASVAVLARDIHKSFGSIHILKGISLEVKAHEIVAIVGASGAGKTTLLQILGTLDKPDKGEVYIGDTDIVALKGDEQATFRSEKIGFIFQNHQLLPELTALENLMLPALIKGTSLKQAKKEANDLLAYLGIAERAEHKPHALSGGEKQRVAVGRALINKPSVVLADEPSGALDSAHKQDLHKLFLRLREETGQTFIIVTHDESLTAIADRTITLKDGRIYDPNHYS